jgi:tRNA pseudouridine55 synthase
MDGLIILDKPVGIRSTRALDTVKRLLPRSARVGHAGSLDPFATGILVVLIGRATRQAEAIMSWRKIYRAEAKLGVTTITDDGDSPEIPGSPRDVTEGEIHQTMQSFVGTIQQRPSLFSAIKIDGRRACDIVRAGQMPNLEPRPVQVYRMEMLEYHWPLVRFEVECGRGTYVRALARDIGEALGTGAYLTKLRRIAVGPLQVEQAVAPHVLTRENIRAHLIPLPSIQPAAQGF